MTTSLWAGLVTILGVWFVVVLSPGPNFFAIMYTSTTQSRRSGLLVVAGVLAGTAVWATASLLGLGLLFKTAAWLYQILKIIGGCYLIYLGAKTILSVRKGHGRSYQPVKRLLTPWQAFYRGLVVDLSNPKAAVFFTSLFAVTVPPDAPIWFKTMIVSAVVAMPGLWYAGLVCLVNLPPVAAFLQRINETISYITGTIFIGLGFRLATDR
jgi:threonine efflux protein